jgi:hypothetical protein
MSRLSLVLNECMIANSQTDRRARLRWLGERIGLFSPTGE